MLKRTSRFVWRYYVLSALIAAVVVPGSPIHRLANERWSRLTSSLEMIRRDHAVFARDSAKRPKARGLSLGRGVEGYARQLITN